MDNSHESYYNRSIDYLSVTSYLIFMLILFLAFGYIRKQRNDKKKVRGLD
jgi:hypothetical protein